MSHILSPYLRDTVTEETGLRVQANSARRKQQFAAALKLAGLTVDQWATNHNITRQHLFYVFRGERKPSAELDAAISTFIAQHLRESAA